MMKPTISIISAMTPQRVIGLNNKMPWYLPADLQHFKALTLNKPIIMGRLTWESLPGLLPQRPHIVISRNSQYQCEGAMLAHSILDAIEKAGAVEEIMIVGGANIYQQALELADKIYLTIINTGIKGDAFFPEIDLKIWQQTALIHHKADAKNQWDYDFLTYQKIIPHEDDALIY